MTPQPRDWRALTEQVSKETDPEKLTDLIAVNDSRRLHHYLLFTYPVLPQTSKTHTRQTGESRRSAGCETSGCGSASLLHRLHKLQQVGIDFILVRGGEAMRFAGIINFLRSLD